MPALSTLKAGKGAQIQKWVVIAPKTGYIKSVVQPTNEMPKLESTVGESPMSPIKHQVLDKLVGKMLGMMVMGRNSDRKLLQEAARGLRRVYLIDLFCGHGRPNTYSGKSSLEIFDYHATWQWPNLGNRQTKDILKLQCVGFELNKGTFDQAAKNYLDPQYFPLFNKECQKWGEIVDCIEEKSIVFLNNDPNNATDNALDVGFLAALHQKDCAVTTFSSFGCNVNGLKRGAFSLRLKAATNLMQFCDWVLPKNIHRLIDQDCLILSLEGDRAQWAYVVTAPHVWKGDLKKTLSSAAKNSWKKGHSIFSYRDDKDSFDKELDRLFLTEKERERGLTLRNLIHEGGSSNEN